MEAMECRRCKRPILGAAILCVVVLLAALLASCTSRIDEGSIDVDRLCRLADAAFTKQDYSELSAALEQQFHVRKAEQRITEQGIYIPVKHRFVEEDGYFLARPGANIILRSGDPAVVRVKGCLFRYHIKG